MIDEAEGAVVRDVVVVGAGLSGLLAARELRRDGFDVIVLEASDRAGGRALSETSALGSRLDLGGQWIGHDHRRVADLAAGLDLALFPMHTGPMPTLWEGRRPIRPYSPAVLIGLAALTVVEVLSRLGPSKRLVAVPAERWLRRVPGRLARQLLEVVAATSWTADLDRLSVAAMAGLVRQQGGLRTMLSTRGGAQESLLVEGAGTLTDRLADELGARVRTGEAVSSLVQRERGVLVTSESGAMLARRAIVAVPAPRAFAIHFEPPLSPARAAAQRSTYMGSVYKAVAVYERPFWRDRSTAEMVLIDDPGLAVFDTSAPGGPGHICILVGGPAARDLSSLGEGERRRSLLGRLGQYLGPTVLEPVSWHEKAWHDDPDVGGGYIALPELGSADGWLPHPAAADGLIHWAGSETATDHPGYLDGAIEAGERAAAEVRAALARVGAA